MEALEFVPSRDVPAVAGDEVPPERLAENRGSPTIVVLPQAQLQHLANTHPRLVQRPRQKHPAKALADYLLACPDGPNPSVLWNGHGAQFQRSIRTLLQHLSQASAPHPNRPRFVGVSVDLFQELLGRADTRRRSPAAGLRSVNPQTGIGGNPCTGLEEAGEEPGTKLIGVSEAISQARRLIGEAADLPYPVLITGESGTGKEVVARAIHVPGRRKTTFLACNIAAVPETLLASELFGHRKGAFTGADQDKQGLFESADGGILFLDEIGDLAKPMQKVLLRAIQFGEIIPVGATAPKFVKVRILAATNSDLEERVREESFREDLYYRLAVIRIHIPPLRERMEDIDPIAQHLWRRIHGGGSPLSAEAIRALRMHSWPGNVRELENFLHRLTLVPSGKWEDFIRADLKLSPSASNSRGAIRPSSRSAGSLDLPSVAGRNPYSPTSRLLFYGRESLLREIIRAEQSGECVLLIGGRRCGKTSVLERLHLFYRALQRDMDPPTVWERTVPDRGSGPPRLDAGHRLSSLVSLQGLAFSGSTHALAHICARIKVAASGFGIDLKDVPDATQESHAPFEDWFVDTDAEIQRHGLAGLCLLVDEVESCFGSNWAHELLNFLRHLSDSTLRSRIFIVLAGTESLWDYRAPMDGSPPLNVLTPRFLEDLDYAARRAMSSEPFEKSGRTLLKADVLRVTDQLAAGHPWLMTRVLHRLFELERAGPGDVEDVARSLMVEEEHNFDRWSNALGPEGWRLYKKVASQTTTAEPEWSTATSAEMRSFQILRFNALVHFQVSSRSFEVGPEIFSRWARAAAKLTELPVPRTSPPEERGHLPPGY